MSRRKKSPRPPERPERECVFCRRPGATTVLLLAGGSVCDECVAKLQALAGGQLERDREG